MLWLLMWLVYGLIVGLIAKALHPGEDPTGWISTLGIGVSGSFIGGFLNFIMGKGDPFQTSGILMGVIGGVVACFAYRKLKLDQHLKTQSLEQEIKSLNAEVQSLNVKEENEEK